MRFEQLQGFILTKKYSRVRLVFPKVSFTSKTRNPFDSDFIQIRPPQPPLNSLVHLLLPLLECFSLSTFSLSIVIDEHVLLFSCLSQLYV